MLTALLTALVAAAPLQVQATLLRARAAPEEDAHVVAYLRINTAVVVLEERQQWARVAVAGRPAGHAVEGWVLREYLAEEPLTVQAAGRAGWAALEAGDEAAAAAWGERQLVLAGDAPLEDPAALYREPGHVHAPREPTGPVHLAACDGRRVEYLGHFEDDWDFVGGWRGAVTAPGDGAEPADAGMFLLTLSAQHWIAIPPGDGPMRPIEGSPFVRPFVVATWNAEYQVVGEATGLELGESTVVLGACDRQGELYLSRPVGPARPRSPGSGELQQVASSLVPRREGYELSAHDERSYGGLTEVVVDSTGDLAGQPFTVRSWIADGGAIRGEAEVGWWVGDPDPIPERTWFAPDHRVLVGVIPFTADEKSFNRGFVVLVWRPGGARFVSVLTEGQGC